MLTASTALTNALQKGDALKASARVIAEWNHNRHSPITTVDNFNHLEKDFAYDLDTFPISSITEPVRPTAGIAFAKAGEAVVSSGHSSVPSVKRYYTTDPDSKYKYWTSPEESSSTRAIANAIPYVIYTNPVSVNKIYLGFENAWAYPSAYLVQTTLDGTNWTTVYTGTGVATNGSREIYLQDNGTTWGTTPAYTRNIKIKGVRVNVTQMSKAGSYLNVIEIGARLVSDLSDYVVDYEVNNEIGSPDFITPMGTVSANTGSITLSNYDGRFNNDNPDSLYYGLIDANVKFTIDVGVDTSLFGGAGIEYVRQATMYADNWSTSEESANVDLKDASKYLQETNPLAMLMENVSIGKAIWRILDSVGFNSYAYNQAAESSANVIPYFWTSPDKTVWDIIQELCRVTQSAVWFDQYGVLQIMTRDAAFDPTKATAWTLDYAQNGQKLPDIADLSVNNSYEANKVTVNYKPTSLAEDAQHRPISEIVWEPEGDVVLRSSALASDMTASQMTMTIDPKDAAYWPYEGMANVRGEIIKYNGKAYKYIRKTDNKYGYATVKTVEEKLRIDNDLTADGQQYRNVFTGVLFITERGVDATTAGIHDTTIAGWMNNAFYGTHASLMKVWNGGLKHIPQDSILRLQTNKNFNGNYWYCARRQSSSYADPNYYFGTRMKFPSAGAGLNRAAGLFFNASADMRSMYVVDIMTTKAVSSSRGFRNEIAVIRRDPGKNTYIGKGAVYAIGDNLWYDIDVQMVGGVISVSVNGRTVLNAIDPAADLPATSRQGLNVRGFTVADFEYYYFAGFGGGIFESGLDNSTYMDLRNGGYYSNQYYRDYTYNETTYTKRSGNKTTTYKQRTNQKLFDEFGMNVHEMREYKIKFEKPVIYSSLYVSNADQSVTTEYTGNPFGAKFIVANASRLNSVLNGDDSTLGIDNIVNQRMMVTGRTVQQKDIKTYEVSDKQAIRARGEIPITFESDWIQSEAAAKALGDWIVKNWAKPADEAEVEVYGNPLFQLGDIVGVNYDPRDMTAATHRYFVIGVTQSWDDGPTTKLHLRRAHI